MTQFVYSGMERLAKGVLRRLGLTIVRSHPPAPDMWSWMRTTQTIQTVIDIGANKGDYVDFLARFFKPRAVYAFEPLASCQPVLLEKANRLPNLQLFNVALSDYSGEATFFENSYPPSSSLLHVSQISTEAFPKTSREVGATVRVERLDDLLAAERLPRDVFIKLDVQGVEDRVIRGGQGVFAAAKLVLIEQSFVPLYDGQPLFEEIHQQLVQLGLRLAGLKNQVDDPGSGRPLFGHFLYFRPER